MHTLSWGFAVNAYAVKYRRLQSQMARQELTGKVALCVRKTSKLFHYLPPAYPH